MTTTTQDEYRFEIEATAGPAREGILYGRSQLMVRVRLFDGPGVIDTSTGQPAGSPKSSCCTGRPPTIASAA